MAKGKPLKAFPIEPGDPMVALANSTPPNFTIPEDDMDVSLAELEKKAAAIVMPLLRSTRVTPRQIQVMLEEIIRVRAEIAMLASVKEGLKESAEGKSTAVYADSHRRRKRALLPEFKKLMSKKTAGNTQDDLDAVRGNR
jgi:hypothetical protein